MFRAISPFKFCLWCSRAPPGRLCACVVWLQLDIAVFNICIYLNIYVNYYFSFIDKYYKVFIDPDKAYHGETHVKMPQQELNPPVTFGWCNCLPFN